MMYVARRERAVVEFGVVAGAYSAEDAWCSGCLAGALCRGEWAKHLGACMTLRKALRLGSTESRNLVSIWGRDSGRNIIYLKQTVPLVAL